MKLLRLISLFSFLLNYAPWAFERMPTVAILEWENNANSTFRDFVRGVPDMMMTNLSKSGRIRIIERLQVKNAYSHFRLEESGLLSEDHVQKIGTWLGADYLMLGNFTNVGNKIRLDARIIDASSGLVVTAESSSGQDKYVISLVDNLCEKILNRLTPNDIAKEKKKTGGLKISFKMYMSLLTSRPVYHQRCRIFLDDRPVAYSPIIDRENIIHVLLDTTVTAGSHVVTVVHYYVGKDGGFKHEMEDQPSPFFINVQPNRLNDIAYRCKIGTESETFEKEMKNRWIKLF